MAAVWPNRAVYTRSITVRPRQLLTVGPHDNQARERPIHLTTAGLHILALARLAKVHITTIVRLEAFDAHQVRGQSGHDYRCGECAR